jgi:uncharacterized protein YecE (DUF72 family)
MEEAEIAENAIKDRIRDEEEEIATLIRRKRRHTYHYTDDKTCELCQHCRNKEEYGSDVYCDIDNQDINYEDAACNAFKA